MSILTRGLGFAPYFLVSGGLTPGSAAAPAAALIRRAVLAVLKADPGVTALVGQKIFPNHVPQEADYPALTYQLISRANDRNVNGPGGLSRALFQFTTHSRDLDGEAVSEALRQLLDGPASAAVSAGGGLVTIVGATLKNERDLVDRGPDGTDRPVYLTSADYLFRYREPRPRSL